VVGSELPQRRSARLRRPALHGKEAILFQYQPRRILPRGTVIGFVQGFSQPVGVEGQANASIVELFQVALDLFQTLAQLRERTRFERQRGNRHAPGLVAGNHHHVCKAMVTGNHPPRQVHRGHTLHLVEGDNVEPEVQIALLGPLR
jgi:hypothetical protein